MSNITKLTKAKLTSLQKDTPAIAFRCAYYIKRHHDPAGENNMPTHVDVMNSKNWDTTKRVFCTCYCISKNNRPLGNHQGLVDLQSQNGIDMGIGLHSRFSATAIIGHIAHDMLSADCYITTTTKEATTNSTSI
ncbi:hypothetical protein LOD99_894 [Oopsacas minuta]|uniref:Uncharacterized protein n=1 Tax=Oopsacas minuta TaxID=111878 RepID=A0AAV7JZU2_9METZ|nr:hypothetical protein LOD99_894 [Oopsacas minuta]